MTVIDGLLHEELEFIQSKKYRNGYVWEVRKKRAECEICPKCATPSKTWYGKATSLVRDQALRSRPIWLKIHKHRYYCKSCRKPFTEPVPGVLPRRKTTQGFRKTVLKSSQLFVNLSSVQKELRISSGLVHKIFYEQAEIKLRERKGIQWPKKIGIDEHFFSRSRGFTEFVTVFTNLNKGKLFEMARGKDKKGLMEQVQNIPGRENVRIVAIDLSRGYRSLVKELFPNAVIVADKFHVVRLLMPELIKQRRAIHGHRQDLKTRRLLLKSRVKLEYSVRCDLDRYLKTYPQLKPLYDAKEKVNQLYRTKGLKRARIALQRTIEFLMATEIPAVQKTARTLRKWSDQILAYFEYRVTNAVTEAINGRAKSLQRRACGYKSFKNYRLAVLSACAF